MTLTLKTEKHKSAGMVPFTAGGAVTAGTPQLVGGRVAIPLRDLATGESDELPVKGRFRGVKKDEAWTTGDRVGWDSNGDPVVGTAGTGAWTKVEDDWDAGYYGGIVTEDAAQADEYGVFDLNEAKSLGYKLASGQHTTVAASDTVVTGLAQVIAVVAQLDDDPVDGAMHVTSSIGDQAGAPAAGSILLKTWRSTDGDATLIAANTFAKKVNWIAIGN